MHQASSRETSTGWVVKLEWQRWTQGLPGRSEPLAASYSAQAWQAANLWSHLEHRRDTTSSKALSGKSIIMQQSWKLLSKAVITYCISAAHYLFWHILLQCFLEWKSVYILLCFSSGLTSYWDLNWQRCILLQGFAEVHFARMGDTDFMHGSYLTLLLSKQFLSSGHL